MTTDLSAKSKQITTQIAEAIANEIEVEPGNAKELTLAEFRNVYIELVRQLSNQNPYVVLVFLVDQVIAAFPQHSPQKFQILSEKKKPLTRSSFDFILYCQTYGLQERPKSFIVFLRASLKIK